MKIPLQFLGTNKSELRSGVFARAGHPLIFSLNRLARAGLCCLFLLASLALQGQGCVVNAGGDFNVCFDDDGFMLMADVTGDFDDMTYEWTGPAGFDIQSPNSENTNVVPTGADFPAGTYEFELSIFCNADNMVITDIIEVTVLGPVTTPVISWNGVPEDGPITVCRTVDLTGTLPVGNEGGQWLVLEGFSALNYSLDVNAAGNEMTFGINNNTSSTGCATFTFVYRINNACFFQDDTLVVEFLQSDAEVRIRNIADGAAFCGNEFNFAGSNFGCTGEGTFTFTSTPNNILPTLVSGGMGGPSARYNFTNSGSGPYTITYEVDVDAPCVSGIVEVDFFICVVDLEYGDTRFDELVCGQIPATGVLVNDNPALAAGCPPQPWVSDPASPDIIIDQVNNTYTITDPALLLLDNIVFSQLMTCQTCTLDDGSELACNPEHEYRIERGPEITISPENSPVILSCGGDPLFRPFDYIDIFGAITSRVLEVTDAPDTNPDVFIGQMGNIGSLFNMTVEGTYEFTFTVVAVGDNGVSCDATAELTVIVQTLNNPSAGIASDTFCLGDTIFLAGSDPMGPANILWTQLDANPPLTFETSNDITDPFIVVNNTGCYELEYSFSREDICYLADSLEFCVVECDSCTEVAWEYTGFRCLGNDTYWYSLEMENAEDCGEFSVSSNGNNPINYTVSSNGGNVVITGTVSGLTAPGSLCLSIDFANESCCDFRACRRLICCETSPKVGEPQVDCRRTGSGEDIYVVTVNIGDPNGWASQGFDLTASCGGDVDFSFVDNGTFLTVTAIISNTPAQPGQFCCLTFEFENERLCDVRTCFTLPPCCEDVRWDFRDVRCVGLGVWSYTLVIPESDFCGSFQIETNGDQPAPPDVVFDGVNVTISGTITGLIGGDDFCISVDYNSERCCDFEACVVLPPCCEIRPRVGRPNVECQRTPAGDNVYTVSVIIGDPNGWASEGFNLTSSCGGDVTFTFTDLGNALLVNATISNTPAQPGQFCCLVFDFDNDRLCNTRTCFVLPPCCDDVRWVFRDITCVSPGVYDYTLVILDSDDCGSFNINTNGTETNPPTVVFTGVDVIVSGTVSDLSAGDQLCVSIDYNSDRCCDFEACSEPLEDCCTENRWEYTDLVCNEDGSYTYTVTVFGAADCGSFGFSTNGQQQGSASVVFSGGNTIISATVAGLVAGDQLCLTVNYFNDECCDFVACTVLPNCCDEKRWEYREIVCAGDGTYTYTLTIFDVGDCGGFSFSTNGQQQGTPTVVFSGGNVTLSATVAGLAAGEELCLTLNYGSEECCDFVACTILPDCCDDVRWEFTEVVCSGDGIYTYTAVLFDVAGCTSLSFSTNGQQQGSPSVSFDGTDMTITASVAGLSAGEDLCLTVDFNSEDCCDFVGCTTLPECCEEPATRIVDVECDRDSLAEVSYTISVEIEDPNDWVLDGINVSSACGTASVVSLVDQGNSTLAIISLTNVSAEVGDECCIALDFVNENLCDTSVCFIIEECPCYVDLEVDFPPCITPGEEFEVTYTFDYQGDPSTGVNALWTVFNQDPGNPWQIVDGDVQPVVNFGFNTHTITLVYNGECEPPGSTDLTVLAFFYTSTGIECCRIVDTHSPECCCECDVTLTYCSDEEEIEQLVKVMSTDRRYKDDKLAQEFVQRFTSRTKEDGCDDKECCYICEEPFFLGPILAKVEGCDFDENPDNYTFLWNTGQTTQAIIGTSIGNPVYSVTVTNVVTGCEYTAEIEIICDEEVREKEREQERYVEKRNDTNPDASVEQAEGIELKAYPVPADDLLTISSTALIGQDVYLTNTLGRVMLSNQNVQTEKLVLNVSNFATGIYFIQVKDKDGRTIDVRKVLIVD